MWFPYTLPAQWKAECERERVNDSQADTSEREFLVGFFLRNPVSQENQVELHLSEPQWHQFEYNGIPISVGFYPHDEERLAEILIRTQAAAATDAVSQAYGFVSRLLDHWSAWYGRGFGIDGYRVADLRHEARWRAVTHRPSSEQFSLPEMRHGNRELERLFALYRTVRTSNSPVYRFLRAYQLIGLIINRPELFNSSESISHQKVMQEMLVISGLIKYQPELEGYQVAELPQVFRERNDALQPGIQDPDNLGESLSLQQLDELECISNLLDMICHKTLARMIETVSVTEEVGEPVE